jgi:hypothetical protein
MCWPPQKVFQEEQVRDWQKTLKLKNMDLRRWASVIKLYASELISLSIICRTYYKRAKVCPLRKERASMVQQYSILKQVHKILVHAQGGGFTGPTFLLNLMDALHGGVLDLAAPLQLYDPATDLPKVAGGVPQVVEPGDLKPVAARIRELLRKGVESRFLEGRYKGDKTASFIWDAAAMAHPAYAGRLWVNQMAASECKSRTRSGCSSSGVVCAIMLLINHS